jgi:hypothetical protein
MNDPTLIPLPAARQSPTYAARPGFRSNPHPLAGAPGAPYFPSSLSRASMRVRRS